MHQATEKINDGLFFGKVGPERKDAEREEEPSLQPIAVLNGFNERDTEKDDEYREVREWRSFHAFYCTPRRLPRTKCFLTPFPCSCKQPSAQGSGRRMNSAPGSRLI